MKKLMYIAVSILALGLTHCKSDDDGFDCNAAAVTLGDAVTAYSENNTTATCQDYKEAIEDQINNNCITDEETVEALQLELRQLGDCTFSGRVCLSCTNSNVVETVCRGENGNAFIDDRDLDIPFERYVELSSCE